MGLGLCHYPSQADRSLICGLVFVCQPFPVKSKKGRRLRFAQCKSLSGFRTLLVFQSQWSDLNKALSSLSDRRDWSFRWNNSFMAWKRELLCFHSLSCLGFIWFSVCHVYALQFSGKSGMAAPVGTVTMGALTAKMVTWSSKQGNCVPCRVGAFAGMPEEKREGWRRLQIGFHMLVLSPQPTGCAALTGTAWAGEFLPRGFRTDLSGIAEHWRMKSSCVDLAEVQRQKDFHRAWYQPGHLGVWRRKTDWPWDADAYCIVLSLQRSSSSSDF